MLIINLHLKSSNLVYEKFRTAVQPESQSLECDLQSSQLISAETRVVMKSRPLILALWATSCAAFQKPSSSSRLSPRLGAGGDDLEILGPVPRDAGRVIVEADAAAVGKAVWARVEAAAKRAIDERGRFALAVPGGSVLKMLEGTSPEWAKDTLLAYVNHKAVAMDDLALATHAKATKGFLKDWEGVEVIELEGTSDRRRAPTRECFCCETTAVSPRAILNARRDVGDCLAEACRYAEIMELADMTMLPKTNEGEYCTEDDAACLPQGHKRVLQCHFNSSI